MKCIQVLILVGMYAFLLKCLLNFNVLVFIAFGYRIALLCCLFLFDVTHNTTEKR